MTKEYNLEQLLNESGKYLKIELGLEKPEASICSCSENVWSELRQKGISGSAFYNPKEERIYLGPEASIADLMHEYFGHALYTEQTLLGKKFQQTVKEDNQIKKETLDFFNKLTPLQEGFSIWMEEKILKQLGLTDLWQDRYELIAKGPYHGFYNSFLKEESEKGTITLLYKLGFPKSKDNLVIKKVAQENLKNFDKLTYLVQYGSLERDIDLLAVYPDNILNKEGLIYDGCIDINVLSESSFLQKSSLYDIEILEPILTGNLIIGDEKSFENLKSKIRAGKPSNEAVEYANRRSLETFNSAMFFYDQNRFKCYQSLLNTNPSKEVANTLLEGKLLSFCSEDLLYTLNNLSFSLSYKLSAEHYAKNRSFVTFKDLRKDSALDGLVKYLKDVENGKKELKEDVMLDFIEKTKGFLLTAFLP